jgi:hypothetical protein
MPRPPRPTHQAAPQGDFTPELVEPDIGLGRTPIYWEEAGRKPGTVSEETLRLCPTCGARVIAGVLENGTLVPVEPDVPTYNLIWHNRELLPQLTLARGYPGHRCRPGARA